MKPWMTRYNGYYEPATECDSCANYDIRNDICNRVISNGRCEYWSLEEKYRKEDKRGFIKKK